MGNATQVLLLGLTTHLHGHTRSRKRPKMSDLIRIIFSNFEEPSENLFKITESVVMSIRTLPATYKGDFSWNETNFFIWQNPTEI